MGELKYCRVCLVTDVKMYSLDITSNDSIGLIYSHLAQIRICDRNQHVCFECASLLQKYQIFKSKCLRAHNILSGITVHSTEITKQVIENIDRKENKLESSLKFSPTSFCCEPSPDSFIDDCKNNEIELKTDDAEQIELGIKTEIPNTEIHGNSDDINYNRTTDKYNETYFTEPVNNTTLSEILIKDKTKEPKTKKRKIKKEITAAEIVDKCDINESFDDFNDNDFNESAEENIPIETSTRKRKPRMKKEPKFKKRKIQTVLHSEDNLSDNEPLSKCATKSTTEKVEEPFVKKNGLNIEFFDGYTTVSFLTPDDARKELLSRKDSSNYKRSPFKCEFCYKGYEAKAAFENHMKKHSMEYGDHECDLCRLRFPKHIYLCKHKLSCHKRKFSCKLCPYVCYCIQAVPRCRTKNSTCCYTEICPGYQARTHVSLHKGKKYPCKDCGEIFSMPNSLLMHKRVKHLTGAVPESVCALCGNTFGSPRGLFLHNMKLHRTDNNSKQGPKCDECGVHFSSEVAWKRHLVLSTKHTVSNGCKYCGERFTNVEELKTHKRTHHQRVKPKRNDRKLPAACTVCNKWLSSHVEYNNHVSTEHPLSDEARKLSVHDITPFVCEVCGQTFKQQCFLTYHQRKHTGERPYKCADCGKTFQMAGALSIHRTVHSRQRQHKCHMCARVFSFKSALNKHMKVHLGIRPHKCTICDKGFIHMCDLKLHIKYVHDKVPWPKKKSKRTAADDNATYLEYN